MQSEAGAAGMVHGSLLSGALTTTYTASQGLLLMIPNMYKIAGEGLPLVINVAARSLATHALSIMGDHQDIYATRMTGFAILMNSSVQDIMDLTSVAHLSAIKGHVPFVNGFDGFRTSHELDKIEVIDLDKVKELIDMKALNEFRNHGINLDDPHTFGTSEGDDVYFQNMEARNSNYDALPDIVNDYMKKINKITGRDYKPFNYYGSTNAKYVIVAMGSVCETIKETIDYLINEENLEIGLLEVHLYRPFSMEYFLSVLPKTVTDIAVLDRTKEFGANAPLYLDVVSTIKEKNLNINVYGGRYGLSSKNTTPYQIKAVYSYLSKDEEHEFTIGIKDDVTNLSLEEEYFDIKNDNHEMIVYGYASDGMVSASKDIIKIIGNNTKAYAQGYFEYDSRKSGGLTKCHLRFGSNPIRATYYVEQPNVVVCTKDDYLKKYSMLKNIKQKGIFVLNTDKTGDDLSNLFSDEDKKIIKEKKIKIYAIDASKIASSNGIGNKINMIISTIIFKVSNIIPFDFAFKEIKKSVESILSNKGKEIIEKNIKAIDETISKLKEEKISNIKSLDEETNNYNVFDLIDRKEGNNLSVSELSRFMDGTFPGGLSKEEEKNIAEKLPCYNSEKCIMCNQCSLVCPHAVIRPILLDEKEEKKLPEDLRKNLKDSLIKDQKLKYTIAVDYKNCTGCGLCSKICPGKKGEKALTMKNSNKLDKEKNRKDIKYLFNDVKEHAVLPINTLKGSQFVKPKFEFSGACAGCGQTPYLKLLTQLFGNELVIANATGCSSIYGGSIPKTPYSIPWASSLFEDNAEFGYGLAVADRLNKEKIKKIIYKNIDKIKPDEKEIYASYYKRGDYASSCLLYEIVNKSKNKELTAMKDFIKTKSYWIIGGDGWAYDIGFGGLDHVLASNENVNILVLDTEVYSNTGGQMSKSSRIGSVSKFASSGKQTNKKDLSRIALSYPHVYVATVSLGANINQTIKAFNEAKNYNGPSIIIAYAPCIAHGIISGMNDSIEEEAKATNSGYFPLFRYNPVEREFSLDSKADFERYFEFILGENRYRTLKKVNPDKYKELLESNKQDTIERYEYYKSLSEKENTDE